MLKKFPVFKKYSTDGLIALSFCMISHAVGLTRFFFCLFAICFPF